MPKGSERLRLTSSPVHSPGDIEALIEALTQIWVDLGLEFADHGFRPVDLQKNSVPELQRMAA